MNKAALSKLIRKPAKVIDDWLAAGCPHKKDARGHYVFDLADVWMWREDHIRRSMLAGKEIIDGLEVLDKNAEQARLAKEQADKLSMDNAEKRGELLDQQRIAKAIEVVFVGVRSKVLSIPTKAAAQLVGVKKAAEAEGLLNEFCHDALRDVSKSTVVGTMGSANHDGGSERGDGMVKASNPPAKANNKRVGGRKKAAKSRVKRGAGKLDNVTG